MIKNIEGLCPFADTCEIDERGSLDCVYNYEDCSYYQRYLKEGEKHGELYQDN